MWKRGECLHLKFVGEGGGGGAKGVNFIPIMIYLLVLCMGRMCIYGVLYVKKGAYYGAPF